MKDKQTHTERHFVLVHGACHGAWCWYRVATLLKFSGVHLMQARDLNSTVEYVEPLFEFLEGLHQDEKVILVGHSMGGLVLSMAMDRFPEKVDVAVFAAAFMPGPELSIRSIVEEACVNRLMVQLLLLLIIIKVILHMYIHVSRPKDLHHRYYFDQKMEKELLLIKPIKAILNTNFYFAFDQTMFGLFDNLQNILLDSTLASYLMEEEVAATKGKYGAVRRVYILCDNDLIMTENMQRWMVEMNPPDKVKVISGSDHMVMHSDALGETAECYCS
ncbi:hypothetical protein BT93_H1158 [Corymbia citriodora subsp. variegata]|nr:hypothetical protein BT93_H1158 [Corymbia citriodora subsp. variegata]